MYTAIANTVPFEGALCREPSLGPVLEVASCVVRVQRELYIFQEYRIHDTGGSGLKNAVKGEKEGT